MNIITIRIKSCSFGLALFLGTLFSDRKTFREQCVIIMYSNNNRLLPILKQISTITGGANEFLPTPIEVLCMLCISIRVGHETRIFGYPNADLDNYPNNSDLCVCFLYVTNN